MERLESDDWRCEHTRSVEQFDASRLDEVIRPHGYGSAADRSRNESLLESLSDLEDGHALKIEADFPFWDAWMQRYSALKTGNESERHVEGKVYAAAYLDACGHDLRRSAVTPDHSTDHRWVRSSVLDAGWNRHWIYSASNFERGLGYGRADAACHCDNETVAVEFGRMDPEKYMLATSEDLLDYLVVGKCSPNGHPRGRRRYDYYVFDVRDGIGFDDE